MVFTSFRLDADRRLVDCNYSPQFPAQQAPSPALPLQDWLGNSLDPRLSHDRSQVHPCIPPYTEKTSFCRLGRVDYEHEFVKLIALKNSLRVAKPKLQEIDPSLFTQSIVGFRIWLYPTYKNYFGRDMKEGILIKLTP